MNRNRFLAPLAVAGLAAAFTSIALAGEPSKTAPAGQPQMTLPAGWTEADMQACMMAGTPGEQHAFLAEGAGVWYGKANMWMGPGSEPVSSDITTTITVVMDGRYVACETEGDMPGMGPFVGHGVYGFDNVSQKFVSSWIDNHSTGLMHGTGERSADGKTMTWKYTYNCPITKKPTVMREVERTTGPDSKTLEMFTIDPKSGKEYKMMEIAYTRRG